jgi:polyhydroxyalkanoate synthesis repressor PhaR
MPPTEPAECLIRKYPNRRLYDTARKRFVNLGDVHRMLLEGETIRVVEAESGEDVTRAVLLQIIVERETGAERLLSNELLESIVRFYGGMMQEMMARYLDESVNFFVRRQREWPASVQQFVENNPMTALLRQNLESWQRVQEAFLAEPRAHRKPAHGKRKRGDK